MRRSSILAGVISMTAASLVVATSGHSATFLDIQQYEPGVIRTAAWTANSPGAGGTFSIATTVIWSDLISGFTDTGAFTLSGTSVDKVVNLGGFLAEENIDSGTFSIIDNNISPGFNVLSGAFSNTNILGFLGSNGATFAGDTMAVNPGPASISYWSDIFSFNGGGTDNAFTITIGDLSQPLSQTAQGNLGSFAGVPTGSFSTAIPEPATWALMLLGVFAVGAALRAQRRPDAVAN